MAKIVILYINVHKGIRKEKIDCTFKIARFEEFWVVAEVPSFVGNPVDGVSDGKEIIPHIALGI